MSNGYGSLGASFLVPPGRPISSLQKIFSPFDITVWYILIILLISFTIISIITSFFEIKLFTMLDILRIFLGLEIPHLPQMPTLKAFIILLMLNFLVLKTGYQGSLYSYLSNKQNTTHAETIKEIIDKGYTFYFTPTTRMFIEDSPLKDR